MREEDVDGLGALQRQNGGIEEVGDLDLVTDPRSKMGQVVVLGTGVDDELQVVAPIRHDQVVEHPAGFVGEKRVATPINGELS